jgi:hypothetical protein
LQLEVQQSCPGARQAQHAQHWAQQAQRAQHWVQQAQALQVKEQQALQAQAQQWAHGLQLEAQKPWVFNTVTNGNIKTLPG